MYCHCMDYVANPIVYRGMVSLPCVHGKSWFVALSLHHLFYIVLSWFIMYYLCLFPWTIGNSRYSRYGASLLIPIHWHFRTPIWRYRPPSLRIFLGPWAPPMQGGISAAVVSPRLLFLMVILIQGLSLAWLPSCSTEAELIAFSAARRWRRGLGWCGHGSNPVKTLGNTIFWGDECWFTASSSFFLVLAGWQGFDSSPCYCVHYVHCFIQKIWEKGQEPSQKDWGPQ